MARTGGSPLPCQGHGIAQQGWPAQQAMEARTFLDSLEIFCPKCNHSRSAGRVQPRANYKWAILTCRSKSCKTQSKANFWSCSCRTYWRACKFHSKWDYHAKVLQACTVQSPLLQVPSQASTNFPVPSAPPEFRRKRARTKGAEQVVSDKLSGATSKRKLPVQSAPQLSLNLSKAPKLAAKFPHLFKKDAAG